MNQKAAKQSEPLWLAIEQKIRDLGDHDLAESALEGTVQRLAGEFDASGLDFSRRADHMLLLRGALGARTTTGRPLLQDFESALAALSLDDVVDIKAATRKLVDQVGAAWPKLKLSDRRADVQAIVADTRLKLLVKKAEELGGDQAIRYLLAAELKPGVIMKSLGIDQAEFSRVEAEVAAELAERKRVSGLLAEVEGKPDPERVKHLINAEVAEELILEMAGVEKTAVDEVQAAMEAELAEKKRKAEEEAARKKAEAEGPPLEEIPDDQMLDYIESIREVLEFSDVEDEIRTMCEQSSIPKSLVDIAVSNPDQLDELETKAGG
jgi:hypothetical protein